MIHPNGHDSKGGAIQAPVANDALKSAPEIPAPVAPQAEPATRSKQRAKQQFQQNRFVIIGAGAIVVALLIFVATSMPHKNPIQKSKSDAVAAKEAAPQAGTASGDKTLFPITDSGRPPAKETHEGFLNEQDLERSATRQPISNTFHGGQSNAPGTLGSIPPFGGEQQAWQAPPYQPGLTANNGTEALDPGKAEREAMEKSSIVFVRSVAASPKNSQDRGIVAGQQEEIGLGMATGTRFRARLESAASTAVRAPVLAVVEYTYERDGEIVVPAGAKAVGHLQEADRSGYVRIQFDSLMMPDGAAIPIQAVATDLELRPLRGKVEGKNTGKNVLVRSLSGIGTAGAVLLGRGSLNQPLSESDLLRERVSNNVGEASDEQVSRLAVTQHIVVTIPADTPIYVVLEQTPKASPASALPGARGGQPGNASAEQLRQLLQLQRELSSSNTTNQ